MERPDCVIVWFKRDLRLQDHAPLRAAIGSGLPVLLWVCFEPSWMRASSSDVRHWRFLWQAAADVAAQIRARGGQLYIVHDEVLPALDRLSAWVRVRGIYAHQETHIGLTFERDQAVQAWCRARGVPLHEYPANGVIRGLRDRRGWIGYFSARMHTPIDQPDWGRYQPFHLSEDQANIWQGTPLPPDLLTKPPEFQPGGEAYAHRYLRSFVDERASGYGPRMSRPEDSRRVCSRLSPYLAFGCLSVRQVWQAAEAAKADPVRGRSMKFFQARLWWHCHYIQKFEMDCRMEHLSINRAYDHWRKPEDDRLFYAWAQGRTGYPLVDACMRSLLANGYLNFRMRAMLISFFCHALWQDWRRGAEHLARLFLDFEPGIHYPQTQYHAYAVGGHFLRIYHPVKQSWEKDPQGLFIRRWVPELAQVPLALLHEPWKMTQMEQVFYRCRIGTDYPAPVVPDIDLALRLARQQHSVWEKDPAVQAENLRITRRLSNPAGEIIPDQLS